MCAVRDSGVRCITEPCPSTEKPSTEEASTEEASYPNACSACADERVFRHRPGACG